MRLKEELKQLGGNTKKDARQLYEKVKQYPLISLFFILVVLSLIIIPYLQVNYQGISNNTEKATLENQYRATFAQILGGVAIGIGLYYTWRRISIAEKDLKVTQESQITERFTRAVDQLGAIDQFGNPATEIRLGGIYALERIANESDKDYWPIMEILTAYVRKNSSAEIVESKKITPLAMDIQANEIATKEVPDVRKVSLDIQAILTVLGRRKNSFNKGEVNRLNLQKTCLQEANLREVHLEGIDLTEANLEGADLSGTRLEKAELWGTHLKGADLREVHLEGADLSGAHMEEAYLYDANLQEATLLDVHLERASLNDAHLEKACFNGAHLEKAEFWGANLEKAELWGANLEGALLIEASLEGALFRETNLEGANLERADLTRANLTGANLTGANSLTVDQLSKVKTLYNAKLDKELEIPLRKKYPALFEKPDQDACVFG